MLYLGIEIIEVKLILAYFLLQLLGLFKIKLLLCTFYKRHDVTHTENTVGHTCGMEHVYRLHLLASTNKLDGLGHNGTDTEGSTTACITVELGKYHTVEVETVVEFLGGIDGILTRHGVDHKERLIGTEMNLEIAYLLHHLLIYSQTTGSIDDNHVITVGLGLLYGVVGYLTHILVVRLAVHRYTHLFAHNMELLDGSRTINVTGNEQRFLATLCLEHIGEFTAEGCLSGSLQAAHEDDGRMAFKFQRCFLAAHQFGQFIMHQFYHQLTWFYSSQHIHTERLLLYLVGKFLGNLIIDVGVKECAAHILHGLGHVNLRYLTFTLQDFERAFQSI